MTIAESVLEKLQTLPPNKQQEVLDFVEFLEQKSAPMRPRRSCLGLFADQGIQITEEEIALLRKRSRKPGERCGATSPEMTFDGRSGS
jgi:hypothetical protein